MKQFWLAVLVLVVATRNGLAQHHPTDPVNAAYVQAKTLEFMSTGPPNVRMLFKLIKRTKSRTGDYQIVVKASLRKGAMEMDNLPPGQYTYKVTAAHSKDFFGDARVGQIVIFLAVDNQMKHPTSRVPTDYLHIHGFDH